MSDPSRYENAPPRVSSDAERERAIHEVLRERREKEEVLEFQRLRYNEEERRRGLGIRHAVFVLALLATIGVWSSPPLWIVPPLPSGPTAAHLDDSMRLALYLEAQRIEAFRDRTGRLPADLAEVGASYPGIRYVRTDRGTYHLEGLTEHRAVFYSSSLDETPAEFLRGSTDRIFPEGLWRGDS